MQLRAERIESVKAGLLAAGVVAIAFWVTLLLNRWLLFDTIILTTALVRSAIAFCSGFLFGVTYRYIVRQDQNSHLRDGAILAFGLVRGLSQIDPQLPSSLNLENLLPLGLIALESLILFALGGLILDAAIQRNWIKPFVEIESREI